MTMNQSVEVIYEIIENTKETITDNEYKNVMENLMVLNQSRKEVLSNRIYIVDKVKLFEDAIYFIEFNYEVTNLIIDNKLEIKNISYD
jgi:hypothetical protein